MAEKLSLRIDNGVRVIEVNDNGDTITLKLGDSEFQKKAYAIQKSLAEKFKEIENAEDITDENDERLEDFRKSMIKSIDEWIGENTCQKVFGNISPSLLLLSYFLDDIIPYIVEYNNMQEKRSNQIMNKYNPNRKGR